MTQESILLFYRAETPIHMGSGTELGVVDMPIQREKVTGFPKLEASGIKGSVRRVFERENEGLTNAIFGPKEDGSDHSSCISFTDAKILLFPVKSSQGIFKWITCPFILERFMRDYNLFLSDVIEDNILKENQYYFYEEDIEKDKKEKEVILEDFKFRLERIRESSILDKIISIIKKDENTPGYLKNKIVKEEIIILSDDSFKFFTEMSTEINTRTRIGDKGIVEKGALFTEEYIPMETILYGFVTIEEFKLKENETKGESVKEKSYKEIEKKLKIIKIESTEINYIKTILKQSKYVQLGGNKTLGKGITQLILEEVGGK